MSEPLDAVRDLSDAFAARDLSAALDCFVPGECVGYVGSERGETANGRDALTALFGKLFLRDEAYAWKATAATVHRHGDQAYVFTEADGLVDADDEFPYRVSGLVELVGDRWLWRHCQGSEPTPSGS